ncbi:phosphoethanolamine transferase [Mucilaginibacter sp. BT774]|nr:phosphoethanolamine transferase [Mucilaginibacter sp. BT774]
MLIFLIPLFLFRKHLRLYLICLIPILLIVPFNLAYILYFHSEMSEATILMILNTNHNEALELLRSYFVVLIIFMVIYLFGLYLLYLRVPNTVNTKKTVYISSVSLMALAISPLPIYDHHVSYSENIKDALYDIFPGNVINGITRVFYQEKFVREGESERKNFYYHSRQDTSIKDKQIHILIIGESSRYDHWGINGYPRNTSPNLSKRKNLVSFSDAAAGGFMTEWAVPLLLTGVGADHYESNFHRKGIIGAFNEIGFQSYWITNQTDYLGYFKIHSLEAQKGYYLLTDFRSTKNVVMDMQLVDTLEKVLNQPGNKKFVIIHGLGSHYSYSARYPDQFDMFKPSNKTITTKMTDKKFKDVLINSYDNSICYTDAVIDSVIALVNKQNAFSSVTYISDHGEDLMDDNRGLTSHHQGSPPTKYIAHVPLFVWYSPKLEAKYPDKISNLLQHKDARVSSQNIIYSLTGMVGICYPTQDSLKDITSRYYKDNKQLIMGESRKIYPCPAFK